MGSDSITSAPAPALPKDLSKKKRTNRSAKLKQNKLDVRREQWLSQVKNKGRNMESTERSKSPPPSLQLSNEPDRSLGNLIMGSRVRDEVSKILDSEFESLVDSPNGSSVDFNDSMNSLGRSSGSSSCSSSSHCLFDNISEEGVDDGCLDDWEVFADALNANENQNHSSDSPVKPDTGGRLTNPDIHDKNFAADLSRSKSSRSFVNCHAWRPDDVFRPQSLPNLSKQHMNAARHRAYGATAWAWQHITPQPSSCPICFEDLDITDSNFIPCSCGFRLCLFCHKRILEVDSRCPGCRKQYDCAEGGFTD